MRQLTNSNIQRQTSELGESRLPPNQINAENRKHHELADQQTAKANDLNQSLSQLHNTSVDDTGADDSLQLSSEAQYEYATRFVEINRPYDYSSRGFGFLLNSGLASNMVLSTCAINHGASSPTTEEILSRNYAQIVVVEHG